MKAKKWKWIILFSLIGVIVITYFSLDIQYAYTPSQEKVKDYNPNERNSFDLFGKHISDKEAVEIKKTKEGQKQPSPENGAIKIDDELLQLGRKTFYEETFGNEVFLTDVLGIIDGPFSIKNVTKALIALRGKGTTNLQVELAQDVTLGTKTYKKGEKINTGIDVAKGSIVPLGLPVSVSNGRIRVGISCAACHATVDPYTKEVIEGAPNLDLNAGLLLALGTNSTAYFTHGNITNLKNYIKDLDRSIQNSKGESEPLPDPVLLENAVDEIFAAWPRGNFDSTIDLKGNPAQIPDSFTLGDHPYGWSGFAAAGPFKGLAVFSSNVHAQNSDSLTQSEISEALFGIDKEVYLGTILQNAANPDFRYKPNQKQKPSQFFKEVDPTPGDVGINQIVQPPHFPKVSLIAPDGVIVSKPGYKFFEQNNAVAAWQNSIQPPKQKTDVDKQAVSRGREVFVKATCLSCHAGSTLTNNKVISVKKIGTEPSRAKSFKKTEKIFGESIMFSFDSPVPLPEKPSILKVPTDKLDPEQIKLAFAKGDSPGGYKVPSLIGLYWTAPYLHDGGVAVGKNYELGMSGTLLNGIIPDPKNSLRAMVDKELRQKVIEANKQSPELQKTHVQGVGHELWVDEYTGFSKEEQEALLDYLLSLSEIKYNK